MMQCVLPRGEERRLVQTVGQVGAGEARRTPCDGRRSTSGAIGLPRACTFRMRKRPARSGASTAIWRSKRPGRSSAGSSTSGRLVAAIRMTPPRDVEAVHLDEELVERLLALVVAAAHAGAAVATDGVDLVDEDDRRRVVLGLLEQVADAAHRRPRTSRRSPSRRSRRRGRRPCRRPRAPAASCPCPAGRRAGRPWGSWRRPPGTWPGPGQELLDLLSSSTASSAPATSANVVLRHVLGDQLGLGVAEVHDAVAAALHLPHEEEEQQDDQRDREQRDSRPRRTLSRGTSTL